jgi:hypothetical protein
MGSNYSERVDKYLNEYRIYLKRSHEYKIFNGRILLIAPVIQNNGRATAHKILVQLNMPKGFNPPEDNDYLYALSYDEDLEPSPPNEPDLFVNPAQSIFPSNIASFDPAFLSAPYDISSVVQNAEGPYYQEKKREPIIVYEIKELVLRRAEKLDPFVVNLLPVKESSIWEITVFVDAEEMETEITQKLYLEFIVK